MGKMFFRGLSLVDDGRFLRGKLIDPYPLVFGGIGGCRMDADNMGFRSVDSCEKGKAISGHSTVIKVDRSLISFLSYGHNHANHIDTMFSNQQIREPSVKHLGARIVAFSTHSRP